MGSDNWGFIVVFCAFCQTYCLLSFYPCSIFSVVVAVFWLSFGFDEQMDSWLGNRKRIIVLNREDMISTDDRNAWANYYARQGTKVVFSNGQLGMVFESTFFNS